MHYQPVPWMVYHLYFRGVIVIPRSNTAQSKINIDADGSNAAQSNLGITADGSNAAQSKINVDADGSRAHQSEYIIRETLQVTN